MNNCFKQAILSVLITAWTLNAGIAQHQSGSDKFDDLNMVEIIGLDYAFEAPDEIPSGWTTFRFSNIGDEPHFFVPLIVTGGRSYENVVREIYPELTGIWYTYRDGEISFEEAYAKLDELYPEDWGYEYRGGSGILAPGLTSEVTLYFEPGSYILECYVKTEDGDYHADEGMMRELIVTEAQTAGQPPEPDIEITLRNFEMTIDGKFTPGRHTVAVHAAGGYGQNVHLARLEPDTDAKTVSGWMHWFHIEGLQVPPPATFVGGMHRLQEGATGYFTVDLEPGRYVFVSGFEFDEQRVMKDLTIAP